MSQENNSIPARDLYQMSGFDDSLLVKHNKTDYEGYQRLQEELRERYSSVEREKAIAERKRALATWDASLPRRWRGGSLTSIENPAAAKCLSALKESGLGSFYLHGPAGSGKTYISHAIVRRMIGAGVITAARVKFLSEEEILSTVSTGFEGSKRFEEMLNSTYRVYIIDSLGTREGYDAIKEAPRIERLIDHIYTNSLIGIFSSNIEIDSLCEMLNESTAAKLQSMVEGREVEVAVWASKGRKKSQGHNPPPPPREAVREAHRAVQGTKRTGGAPLSNERSILDAFGS